MRQLDIDFIRQRHVPWAGLIFLALAAGIGIAVLCRWFDLRSRQENLQARVEKLDRSLQDARRAASDKLSAASPALQEQEKNQKKIMASLAYPWNRVFADIEQSGEDKVAILSFSHDQATSATQLSVEALDVPALVHFVDKMNEEDEGRRWYVASYQFQMQSMPETIKASVSSK